MQSSPITIRSLEGRPPVQRKPKRRYNKRSVKFDTRRYYNRRENLAKSLQVVVPELSFEDVALLAASAMNVDHNVILRELERISSYLEDIRTTPGDCIDRIDDNVEDFEEHMPSLFDRYDEVDEEADEVFSGYLTEEDLAEMSC